MNDDILKGIEINSAGYGTISKLAMQDRRLHITAKAIYAYFNSYTGSGDCCFPTRAKICFDLGISNDTFGKYLKQLIDTGYIKVEQVKEKGRFSHNVYTINGTISPCPKISDTEDFVHGNLDTNNNSIKINSNYKINSNKERKKGYEIIIDGYTENQEVKTAIYEFIKMRKLMKAPMTDRALTTLLNKLDGIAKTDAERIAVLDQSTEQNWKSVYPLKEQNKVKQANPDIIPMDEYFPDNTDEFLAQLTDEEPEDHWKGQI